MVPEPEIRLRNSRIPVEVRFYVSDRNSGRVCSRALLLTCYWYIMRNIDDGVGSCILIYVSGFKLVGAVVPTAGRITEVPLVDRIIGRRAIDEFCLVSCA